MKLEPKFTINQCACGNPYIVIAHDCGIHGTPVPGVYLMCRDCGRRTRKHSRIRKAAVAWNAGHDTEIYNQFSLETKILEKLCRQRCFLHGSWYPIPCTVLAQELKTPVRQVRKAMHNLVDAGYAQKYCYCPAFEDVPRPIHGWIATEKAHTTQVYEDAAYTEAEARESCFQIPKKSTLKELLHIMRRYYRDT